MRLTATPRAETFSSIPQAASHPPSCQSSLTTRRIILDPIDGLSVNQSDAHRLLSHHELLASEARLPAKIGAVSTLLGTLYQHVARPS
jgi:hypothetical protein